MTFERDLDSVEPEIHEKLNKNLTDQKQQNRTIWQT